MDNSTKKAYVIIHTCGSLVRSKSITGVFLSKQLANVVLEQLLKEADNTFETYEVEEHNLFG